MYKMHYLNLFLNSVVRTSKVDLFPKYSTYKHDYVYITNEPLYSTHYQQVFYLIRIRNHFEYKL